jgi:hypothetical protein
MENVSKAYNVEHEIPRRRPILNSSVYDDIGDIDSDEPQSNELDKLVEPSRGPWNV